MSRLLFSLVSAKRICIVAGMCCAFVFTAETANAQYYRFGPSGGVTIRSPFFSLDVPSGPGYYGYTYGPSIALPPVPPVPGYGYYHRRYSSYPYGYAYDYLPYGYRYSPGISSFYYDSGPIYSGPRVGTSRFAQPSDDPYAYRGNLVTPNEPTDPYSVGRVPMEDAAPMDPVRLADELRISAEQLRQSLALRRDDSDVWLDYLNPDAIIDALDETDGSQEAGISFTELVGHYDGVAGNPELRSIASTRGFRRTHELLHHWVDQAHVDEQSEATPPTQPVPESKPAPEPPPSEGDLPFPDPSPNKSEKPESGRRSF